MVQLINYNNCKILKISLEKIKEVALNFEIFKTMTPVK